MEINANDAENHIEPITNGFNDTNGLDNGKTNLEILLTQNDILPLLQKINKEAFRKDKRVQLAELVKSNNKKMNRKADCKGNNARMDFEQDQPGSETDDEENGK